MASLPGLREMRRERLLNDGYGTLRADVFASVRRKLAAESIYFDESELEWFYNQAWQGLNAKLVEGETIANPPGLLVTIMFRRAVDQYRREHAARRARHVEVADQGDDGGDLEQTLDDRTRLRHFAEAISYRLSKQERAVASLCYLHDFTRSQAAALLGMSEKRVQKVMDGHMGRPGVAKKVAAFVAEIESGRWCSQHESTMKAYAFGLLDGGGERYRFVIGHLAECSSCKRYVAGLRGLAAALPPVLLPLGAGGSGSVAALAVKLGLASSESVAGASAGGAAAAGGTAVVGGGAAAGSTIAAGASGSLLTLKAVLGCAVAVTAGGACLALGTGPLDLKPDKPPATHVAPEPRPEPANPAPSAVATPLPTDPGQASAPQTSSGSATTPSAPAPPANAAQQTQRELGIEQPAAPATSARSTPPRAPAASSSPSPRGGGSPGGEFSPPG